MIDLVEIQQMISNLPTVEKISSTSQVLAVNSNNIVQKEMEKTDIRNLNTVVDLSEVLEPIEERRRKSDEELKDGENEEENKSEENAGGDINHINLTI